MSSRPVALLHPAPMIERWSPSRRCYVWVKAYTVQTPDGAMMAPPFPAVTSHHELGARAFCELQGWRVKLANPEASDAADTSS